MKRTYGCIHMGITRHYRDPSVVRWYVRRVWLKDGHSHDLVIAQGVLTDVSETETSRQVVRHVLAAVTAELDRADAERS